LLLRWSRLPRGEIWWARVCESLHSQALCVSPLRLFPLEQQHRVGCELQVCVASDTPVISAAEGGWISCRSAWPTSRQGAADPAQDASPWWRRGLRRWNEGRRGRWAPAGPNAVPGRWRRSRRPAWRDAPGPCRNVPDRFHVQYRSDVPAGRPETLC